MDAADFVVLEVSAAPLARTPRAVSSVLSPERDVVAVDLAAPVVDVEPCKY